MSLETMRCSDNKVMNCFIVANKITAYAFTLQEQTMFDAVWNANYKACHEEISSKDREIVSAFRHTYCGDQRRKNPNPTIVYRKDEA